MNTLNWLKRNFFIWIQLVLLVWFIGYAIYRDGQDMKHGIYPKRGAWAAADSCLSGAADCER